MSSGDGEVSGMVMLSFCKVQILTTSKYLRVTSNSTGGRVDRMFSAHLQQRVQEYLRERLRHSKVAVAGADLKGGLQTLDRNCVVGPVKEEGNWCVSYGVTTVSHHTEGFLIPCDAYGNFIPFHQDIRLILKWAGQISVAYLQGSPAHQNSKYHSAFDLVGTAL